MRTAIAAVMTLTVFATGVTSQAPQSPTVTELLKVLEDKKAAPYARMQAAKALGGLGARAEAALPALVRLIEESSKDQEALRKEKKTSALGSASGAAIDAIGKIVLAIPASPASKSPKTVAEYAKDLGDKEAHTRLAAVKFHQALYAASLAGVAKAVHDDDEDVRNLAGKTVAVARQALAKVELSVQGLIDDLKNKDESVRLFAAKKLGTFGKKAAPALAALADAARDRDEDVARVAKAAIARIKAAKK